MVTLVLALFKKLIRNWDNQDYPIITEQEHAIKFPYDTGVSLGIYVKGYRFLKG